MKHCRWPHPKLIGGVLKGRRTNELLWRLVEAEAAATLRRDERRVLGVPGDVIADVPAEREHFDLCLPRLAQGELDQLRRQALPAVVRLDSGVGEGTDVAVFRVVGYPDDSAVELELVARALGSVGDGLLGHICALPAVRPV